MERRQSLSVLVTGAVGFVGRHVARRFAADGATVVGIGHGNFVDEAPSIWGIAEWRSAEVSFAELSALQFEPDIVIHCAGGSMVSRSIDAPHEDFHRTVASISSVLEFVRIRASGARLVYPSSAAIYGQVSSLPIATQAPPSPISPYGVHKLVGEQLCRSYARQYGLKVSIARYFSVYGQGLRKQLLWDASNRLVSGAAEFAGSGNELRDWIHINDAVELFLAAARAASEACPIANGGTGVGTSVRDIVGELGRTIAPEARITFLGSARQGDPAAYVAEISEARSWGWSPTVPWQEGIADYARWYLKQVR